MLQHSLESSTPFSAMSVQTNVTVLEFTSSNFERVKLANGSYFYVSSSVDFRVNRIFRILSFGPSDNCVYLETPPGTSHGKFGAGFVVQNPGWSTPVPFSVTPSLQSAGGLFDVENVHFFKDFIRISLSKSFRAPTLQMGQTMFVKIMQKRFQINENFNIVGKVKAKVKNILTTLQRNEMEILSLIWGNPPTVIFVSAHNLTAGDVVRLENAPGAPHLNGRDFAIHAINSTSILLLSEDEGVLNVTVADSWTLTRVMNFTRRVLIYYSYHEVLKVVNFSPLVLRTKFKHKFEDGNIIYIGKSSGVYTNSARLTLFYSVVPSRVEMKKN